MHGENSDLVMNWLYIVSIIAISAIALGVTAWALSTQGFSDLSPRWNLIAIVATDIACAAVFAGLIWKTYRDSRTLVTTEGVRRPGLWGECLSSLVRCTRGEVCAFRHSSLGPGR
jgi:hypothetical protein